MLKKKIVQAVRLTNSVLLEAVVPVLASNFCASWCKFTISLKQRGAISPSDIRAHRMELEVLDISCSARTRLMGSIS